LMENTPRKWLQPNFFFFQFFSFFAPPTPPRPWAKPLSFYVFFYFSPFFFERLSPFSPRSSSVWTPLECPPCFFFAGNSGRFFFFQGCPFFKNSFPLRAVRGLLRENYFLINFSAPFPPFWRLFLRRIAFIEILCVCFCPCFWVSTFLPALAFYDLYRGEASFPLPE